jgi:sterol desaturase/sphingolipid hydroxylase (fatty acid hydroxylase superfamily)
MTTRSPSPRPESRAGGWTLDLGGLALAFAAGALVVRPGATALLAVVAPSLVRGVALPGWAAFVLGFVGMDYVQYWAHRLAHRRPLWRVHLAHHTLVRMHALGAYRHGLLESTLMPGLWVGGLLSAALVDPAPFVAAIAAGFVLDAWRHTDVFAAPRGPVGEAVAWALVLPQEHALHHSFPARAVNFGANLKLWGSPPRDVGVRGLFGAGRGGGGE